MRIGQSVMCNGFPGTITAVCSGKLKGVIEVLRNLLDRVDRNGGLGEYKGGVPFATKTARELLAKHGR